MVDTNKTIIIRIIMTPRPSKDHQTVIDQQPDPSPNEAKENEKFLIPGNDEMVQHITPISKSGAQELFAL